METTGQRIREYRKQKGLTQKELGALCGIAEPTIRRYELGKLNPKFETLKKIADALGISWLLLSPQALLEEADIESVLSEMLNVLVEAAACNMNSLDLLEDANKQLEKAAIQQANSRTVSYSPHLHKLLDAFELLNEQGQQAAVDRVEELSEIPKYQIHES